MLGIFFLVCAISVIYDVVKKVDAIGRDNPPPKPHYVNKDGSWSLENPDTVESYDTSCDEDETGICVTEVNEPTDYSPESVDECTARSSDDCDKCNQSDDCSLRIPTNAHQITIDEVSGDAPDKAATPPNEST